MATNTKGMEVSRDAIWAGDYKTKYGQLLKVLTATVSRTDTAARVIGALPAGALITRVGLFGTVDSNAGTTATVDVGYQGGTGLELVNAWDVKGSGATHSDITPPSAAVVAANKVVTVQYAESGSASTTGGPWVVLVEFVTNI